MFDNLLAVTNALSKLLQGDKLDLTVAVSLVKAIEETLQEYRCEAKWNEIWEQAVELASENNIEVESIHRRRRVQPSRLHQVVTSSASTRPQLADKTVSPVCITC